MAEISNLIAADRALGKHISECVWKSRLSDLQEFNTRAIDKKIYRGDNEDPERFLKLLAKTEDTAIQLPLIGYFREVGFGVEPEDPSPDIRSILTNIEGTRGFDIEITNYAFSYSVLVVGHGAASVHEVGIPIHRYFQNHQYFRIPYRILTDEAANKAVKFSLYGRIKEPSAVMFDDATPIKENIKQIYAAKGLFEVTIPLIWGEEIAPVVEEIQFMPMIATS